MHRSGTVVRKQRELTLPWLPCGALRINYEYTYVYLEACAQVPCGPLPPAKESNKFHNSDWRRLVPSAAGVGPIYAGWAGVC